MKPADRLTVRTPHLAAEVAVEGYVSGLVGGTFRDLRTGATDLGFGLSVVDFLLEPDRTGGPIPPGQYDYGPGHPYHGQIPKRYVEGPQICTRAKRLPAVVGRGPGFTAVTLSYRWHQAYPPREQAGSLWEQTLIFPEDARYVLSADRVTVANASDALILRIDMPAHIKHERGDSFEHIYLSYHDPSIIPSTEFQADFPPDARFLYRRDAKRIPEWFIRAYQVNLPDGRPGPWLAGMTLNPADVHEAWCHQRGYVCLIEEIGGRPVRPGDTFGACYVIGWFDDLDDMHRTYDRLRGASGIALEGPPDRPTAYRLVPGAAG